LLLVLLWRVDTAAALASSFAPLPDAPRLVDLLLCAPLLALMLWQWQQAAQAVWLLSRPADAIAAAAPLPANNQAQQRLSLGLPLLLPAPLQFKEPSMDAPSPRASAGPAEDSGDSGVAAVATTVEPEQGAEQDQGHDLDQPVA
jgi:hypothetical protein